MRTTIVARAVLLAAALAVLCAATARAATEPLFSFYASEAKEGGAHAPYPSPGTGFEGPCGLAVDANGSFYVADYYHHAVDVFSPARTLLAQLPGIDPLDGPCAIAVDAAGGLYVNDYHRSVAKYLPSAFPFTTPLPYGSPTIFDGDPAHPTGVAVDPASGRIYVDERSYVAVYEASGAPVEEGGEPLRIGEGTLEDGYGLAVSQYPPTAGRLYVPDAATATIKVYDPALDVEDPAQEIDGAEVPGGGFSSLRDSAIAVDRLSGEIYVADDLQPEGYERPEATIHVFDSAGAYRGHLKYNVIDGSPPGLAVDNSTTGTQGRVYVTSGNTEGSFVYAYTPGAATKAPPICAVGGACPAADGAGAGSSSVSTGAAAVAPPSLPAVTRAAPTPQVARTAQTRAKRRQAKRSHRRWSHRRRHGRAGR
jgi:DNA-binding beta-propeller fold protein YncE